VCARLGASKILLVEPGEQDVRQRIRLNCSVDDVFLALRDDPTIQRFAQAPDDGAAGEE
jgi:hypothetical protein